MSTAVLIDTSIWIEYFRGRDKRLITVMRHLINAKRAQLCGVVLAELLSGAATPQERDVLKQTLDALPYLEMSRSTWALIGHMTQEMRRQGTRIPFTDTVISALAIESDSEVFSTDAHLDLVPKLRRFQGLEQ